jgi:hypothetical protein
MKFLLCSFLLLTAAFAGERAYANHKLERRAQRAVNTLRVVVDPDSDNVEPTSVVYFPNTHALCVEYKNLDQSGFRTSVALCCSIVTAESAIPSE